MLLYYLPVEANANYVLTLQYQGKVGYVISYDGGETSADQENLVSLKTQQSYISNPIYDNGSTKATVLIYTDPAYSSSTSNESFSQLQNVTNNPLIQNNSSPKDITYSIVSPVQKDIHITGAKGTFVLSMSEGYDPNWNLIDAATHAILPSTHVEYYNTMNAWIINTEKLCSVDKNACTKNSDGTYTITAQLYYSPQTQMDTWIKISLICLLLSIIGFGVAYIKKI